MSSNVALAACVVAIALGSAAGTETQGRSGATAAESSTLHARATKAGGRLHEALADTSPVAFANAAELAARAPVIAIGKVLAKRTHLSDDGRSVRTDLAFRVQSRVRGDLEQGAIITVTMPGGVYLFRDGTRVSQSRPGYRPVRDQQRYLLFLREAPAGLVSGKPSAYELAFGAQGQFELDFQADAVVPGVGEPLHPLASRYEGSSIRSLLAEVRSAVPRSR